MFFGANENHYPEMAAKVSGATMIRSFKGLSDTWPVMPGNLPCLLSIRRDPAQLLAGGHDKQITSMVTSAPPHSHLTAWHEANHAGLDAATTRKIHTHMSRLVTDLGSPVRYGAVLTQGASGDWVIPGLDFYGVDLYDIHRTTDPGLALERFFGRMPAGDRIVAETNSSAVYHRPAWFREIYDWLFRRGGTAMLTFWNPTGPLSGPWVDDPATIYALRGISRDARR